MICLEFDRDDCPGVDVDQMWEFVPSGEGIDAVREAVRGATSDAFLCCMLSTPWYARPLFQEPSVNVCERGLP